MNKIKLYLNILLFFIATNSYSITYSSLTDSSVSDFDGNIYKTVTIGTQIWMKENLKSVHYADGTDIPGVVAYNNSDSMAAIYGRLYTWNAAMKNSTVQKTQGVCPNGWHLPANSEWTILEDYLGGALVAGGKMKDTTSDWRLPNKGATNSSGFSALPAGEYDAHYTPNIFQLLNEFAVFWTSTQVGNLKSTERYLAWDSTASIPFNWYKTMKYSIRCIKNDQPSEINESEITPQNFELLQNYPNPFNPSTIISYKISKAGFVSLRVYDMLGNQVAQLVNEELAAGSHEVVFDASGITSGIYFYQLSTGNTTITKKMTYLK